MRRALAKLKWLVVRDLADIETARFWKDSPEVRSGELRSEDIGTEVFLMPCAGHVEKEGSFTNTQRLVQWRDKALDPPGDARSELHFFYHLIRRIKAHYARLERPAGTGRSATSPGTTRCTAAHAGAERRGGAEGDQRLRGRHRAAGELVLGAARRRLDGLRLLDLRRRLRRRRQPGPPARSGRRRRPRRRRRLARVGLGVAGEPPHPLQPRVRRSAGPAVVGAQEVRLVGRGAGQSGRATTCPTSRATSGRTTSRPHDAAGDGRDLRRATRSS